LPAQLLLLRVHHAWHVQHHRLLHYCREHFVQAAKHQQLLCCCPAHHLNGSPALCSHRNLHSPSYAASWPDQLPPLLLLLVLRCL
jgi:hypothetical protein